MKVRQCISAEGCVIVLTLCYVSFCVLIVHVYLLMSSTRSDCGRQSGGDD